MQSNAPFVLSTKRDISPENKTFVSSVNQNNQSEALSSGQETTMNQAQMGALSLRLES